MEMEKDDKAFLEKFQELTNQMTSLINSASDAELEKAGLPVLPKFKEAPFIPLEVKNHEEFMDNMIYRLTGHKATFIIQKGDELSLEDVQPYVEKKRPLLHPSVIRPSGSVLTFTPYITFFTIDGKLAMLPYDGEFFSDLTTRVGKIDPMKYRRG